MRIASASDSVPAQLHVVVQAAANDVHMAVDQSGNGPPAIQVDHAGARCRELHHVLALAHGDEAAVGDGHGIGLRIGAIERGELAVDENQVGCRVR